MEKGYKVTHLFTVYQWDRWSPELFQQYIREFQEMKIHASDWPDSVRDDPAKQAEFVADYLDQFGIHVDPAKMENNPGMKLVAKILNNVSP